MLEAVEKREAEKTTSGQKGAQSDGDAENRNAKSPPPQSDKAQAASSQRGGLNPRQTVVDGAAAGKPPKADPASAQASLEILDLDDELQNKIKAEENDVSGQNALLEFGLEKPNSGTEAAAAGKKKVTLLEFRARLDEAIRQRHGQFLDGIRKTREKLKERAEEMQQRLELEKKRIESAAKAEWIKIEAASKELDAERVKLRRLEGELARSSDVERKEVSNEIEGMAARINELEVEKDRRTEQRDADAGRTEAMEAAHSALEMRRANLEGEVRDLTRRLDAQEKGPQAAEMEQELRQLKSERADLNAKMRALGTRQAELDAVRAELEEREQQCRQDAQTLERSKAELETVRKEIENERSRLGESGGETTRLQKQVEGRSGEISAERESLERREKEFADARRFLLKEVTENEARLNRERQRLEADGEALKLRFAEIELGKTQLEAERSSLEPLLRQAQAERESAVRDRAALDESIRQ